MAALVAAMTGRRHAGPRLVWRPMPVEYSDTPDLQQGDTPGTPKIFGLGGNGNSVSCYMRSGPRVGLTRSSSAQSGLGPRLFVGPNPSRLRDGAALGEAAAELTTGLSRHVSVVQ